MPPRPTFPCFVNFGRVRPNSVKLAWLGQILVELGPISANFGQPRPRVRPNVRSKLAQRRTDLLHTGQSWAPKSKRKSERSDHGGARREPELSHERGQCSVLKHGPCTALGSHSSLCCAAPVAFALWSSSQLWHQAPHLGPIRRRNCTELTKFAPSPVEPETISAGSRPK